MAIAGGVFWFFHHTRRRDSQRLIEGRSGQRPPIGQRKPGHNPARLAAYAVIALMIAASALWLVIEWRSAHEVLGVRVINASTGAATDYEAYRSDIDSRSFRTIDGRRVNLAEVERLEIMDAR